MAKTPTEPERLGEILPRVLSELAGGRKLPPRKAKALTLRNIGEYLSTQKRRLNPPPETKGK